MKHKLLTITIFTCLTSFGWSQPSPKKQFIILSIDGGGIKGVIPAMMLQEIEKQAGKPAYELFDMIGGTSTGGIISTALISKSPNTSKPYTAEEIVAMYQNQGKQLFIAQKRGKKLFKAKYYADNEGNGIEPFLKQAFGSTTTLVESRKFIEMQENARLKQVFTTSTLINSTGGVVDKPVKEISYGPYLFNWLDAVATPEENYYVWEAARATSSAPVFFPIAHLGGNSDGRSSAMEKWAVDGGTMSNNPAMWGISEAFRHELVDQLENITIISIGCGISPQSLGLGITDEGWTVPHDGNWGEFYWVIDKMYDLKGNKNNGGTIVNLMLDAVQMAPGNQLESLAKYGAIRYFRLEPVLQPSQTAMDNTSAENIESLIQTAKEYLASPDGQKKLHEILAELDL